MANPNNAVGTNGAFGGRTSVNAFNDVLATFTGRGVIQGWAVTPSTGLKVNVGGQSGIRDVAIAEDNNGNRTTIDNISQAPIEITMPSAPSTGSRIDLIVGYVENPPQGSSTVIDNPAPTGIITVSGSSSSSPSAPTDSAIRTALTNAGINGATAYYAILRSITISSGTTDISANMIGATPYTNLNTQNNIATGQITADKIDFATMSFDMPAVDGISFSGWDNHFFQSQTLTLVANAKYLLLANTQWFRCWNGNSREFGVYVNGERLQIGYIPNGWSCASFSVVFDTTQTSNLIQTGCRGDWNQQDNSNKCRVGMTTCHIMRIA